MKKFKYLIEAAKDQSRVRGYTHRFYTYPAGFSPVFVEAAIQSLTKKNDLVLDPFMGGGTTIIEALRANRKVVGIDLNPISSFVTKVKYKDPTVVKRIKIVSMYSAVLSPGRIPGI